MSNNNQLPFPYARAICYSGFREGQHPAGQSPSYEEVKEDLLILQGHWKYLRLYDCDPHAKTVLQVIKQEQLDFQVMLGAYTLAEVNNPNCPWGGNAFPQAQLEANQEKNTQRVQELIELAKQYPKIINSLSVGNESTVDWNDHMITVDRVIELAQMVKRGAKQPVTFCENYVPWHNKLKPLVEVLDFISIHTYPVWEYKSIDEAMDYTKDNYYGVANLYPDKPVVITEAGWTTNTNGRGIQPQHVNETLQKIYYNDLMEWIDQEQIITFVFEAFDEPWKGSPDPLEPEKHWGLFKEDRTPKLVMQ